MKLFKNVDERLNEIGFVKVKEDQYGAEYIRKNDTYSYTQCLDLLHKANRRHLIQSYQKDVNSDGFNNTVGLSIYEAKLSLKKMKQMGFKEVKSR
jgi:hypothetical protein